MVRSALRDAGVMVAGEKTGHGYWNGASNPVTSFVIPLPHVGGEGEHTLVPRLLWLRSRVRPASWLMLWVIRTPLAGTSPSARPRWVRPTVCTITLRVS